MSESKNQLPVVRLEAVDHLDADGSVVRSGMVFADAVLKSLDVGNEVTASFRGLKGASSSYFNVFLRRIEEACGVAEINVHIKLDFGSPVQKMIFDRSFDAMRKGVRAPALAPKIGVDTASDVNESNGLWKRIMKRLFQ